MHLVIRKTAAFLSRKRAAFLPAVLAPALAPSLALAWPLDSEWIALTKSFAGLTDIVNDSQGGANDPRSAITTSLAFPSIPVPMNVTTADHGRLENARQKDLDA